MLDYYLLRPRPGGILVEEFVRDRDFTTTGLHNTVWTVDEPRWRSSASFSRAVRTDPTLLTPVDRLAASAVFQQLSGGRLPDEAALRAGFHDYQDLAGAPPLRLGPAAAPDGFHERRVYRVLLAGSPKSDPAATLPAAAQRTGDDHFSWTLRPVGGGLAWALDLTVHLATDADDTVGPLLRELTAGVRRQGLIPVTTERFA